ncbi:hypothetical protein PTKIN_Ptkin18bG0053200 [Pterospermum kingtungense]
MEQWDSNRECLRNEVVFNGSNADFDKLIDDVCLKVAAWGKMKWPNLKEGTIDLARNLNHGPAGIGGILRDSNDKTPWRMRNLMALIKNMKRQVIDWSISHTLGQANDVADKLAKSGVERQNDLVIYYAQFLFCCCLYCFWVS